MKKILTIILISTASFAGSLTPIEAVKMNYIMSIIENVYYGDPKPTHENMYTGALKGLVESLDDPYSEYYTPQEYKSLSEDLDGSFSGIGITMRKEKDKPLEIENALIGSPAYNAGLLGGDVVLKVDGEDILPLTSLEVSKKIRGKKGTKVLLTIQRNGSNKTEDITIVRDIINLEAVDYKMLDNNIGYLSLNQFDNGVGKKIEKAILDLQKKGMKKLIFDLRNNPGGAMNEAIYIASLFVKEKEIMSTVDNTGKRIVSNRTAKYLGDYPMVVLVNENSASASEIVTGVLKDYNRAYIIGTKTFGKGIVQSIMPLSDGSAIKITIAKYATPKNDNIHKNGILPNMKVETYPLLIIRTYSNLTPEAKVKEKQRVEELIIKIKGEKEGRELIKNGDTQLNAAIEYLKKAK